jgi:LPXTG-motif cell wall-anchored protein
MSGTIVVGKGGKTGTAPQTATPLPMIAAAGVLLIIAGVLLGRRRARAS